MPIGQRTFSAGGFQPREAVTECQENRQIRTAFLKGLHHFAPALAHLGRVPFPALGFYISLLAVIKQRPLVLFNIKQNTFAFAFVDEPSREPAVIQDSCRLAGWFV